MSAEAIIRDYYETLRAGGPLAPYFLAREDVVKFGISERLTGYGNIAEGLRTQTETTDDWRIESRNLRVVDFGDTAAFSDDVRMAWRDTEKGVTHDFDSRWSGTLVARDATDDAAETKGDAPAWQFAGMHVSTAHSFDD